MEARIGWARRIKSTFIRYRLHVLFAPLVGVLKKAAYLTELSQWIHRHRPFPYEDRGEHQAEKRFDLYAHVLASELLANEPIDYLEFGVASGKWFKWWVDHNTNPQSRFAGFDTFTGLPEAWGGYDEGAFSTEGVTPDVRDERARFLAGLFQDTLGPFLRDSPPKHRLVIHIDADLYTSTLFALTSLAPWMTAGTVILFDEFGVPTDEFRAFEDFFASYRLKYEVLGAVNNNLQLAVKLV